MAIPFCGTFEYRVNLKRAKAALTSAWVGRAISTRDPSIHPGLAGARPRLRLSDGTVTLQRAESALSRWTNKHFREWGLPPSRVSFQVGDAVSLALTDGDLLWLRRSSTGDLGISILRDEKLVLAVGAVFDLPMGDEVKLANDPRMQDPFQYEIAAALQWPDTKVARIDSAKGDLASWKERLERIPLGGHLIIALREPGFSVEDAIDSDICPRGWPSCSFTSVDPGCADEKAWRQALEPFAGGPPKDPCISVVIRGNEICLREGQEELFGSYFVRLERYFQRGIPGREAILGIAQLSSRLTKDTFVQSLEPFLKRRH